MADTFLQFLINEGIPPEYRISGELNKKTLRTSLTRIAKDRPDIYPDVVQNIKKVGDTFATFEGISVGLDDITPDYAARDRLISSARKDISKLKTDDAIVERMLKAQNDGLRQIQSHKGSLWRQVDSGSRGKPGQFLKTVFSPVVAKGKDDVPQPYLISKSYSEGLSPGEYWVTAGEARKEVAQTQLATALPGDMSKVVTATLNNVMVSKQDCGTKNGVEYAIDDPHAIDRYEAKTNILITPAYLRTLKRNKVDSITVRSPMTCKESPSVCQMCFGKNSEGQMHGIGTNIGMRAAQSLSEPLTQMVLSSKHGGQMARGSDAKLHGALGFQQLTGVPRIFKDEAVLSKAAGAVSKIENSPQGGTFIFVGDTRHYVPPKRNLSVSRGDTVQVGEPLSDGIPNPKQVVALRGLGAGRKYMADTMHDIYKSSGVDMDKRHIELLVRQDLDQVEITDPGDSSSFVRGDNSYYNKVRGSIQKRAQPTKVDSNIMGARLGEEFLHYTTGTPIGQEIYDKLRTKGHKTILTAKNGVEFQPVMKPLEQIPLMSQDWVARLAHRRLKDTLLRGASEAWKSDTRGTSPYAALVYGSSEFGRTSGGHY